MYHGHEDCLSARVALSLVSEMGFPARSEKVVVGGRVKLRSEVGAEK